MAKKLTKSKAREILHDKEVHGHPLTDKQRRFFGAIAGGAKPYQDGGWLDKYEEGGVLKQKTQDNYGVQGNYNDYSISTPPGFVGMGNNLKGRNYSPAWGGQFQDGGILQPPMAGAPQSLPLLQMGGSMPGAVGFMYARTQSPAPSNGPYAKKTKASAQNGQEMKYYQEGLDFKPKTISQNGSRTPIVVTDPKDSRLKAYQDSLNLYNSYKYRDNLYKKLATKYNLKTWKDNNAINPNAKIQPISSQGFIFAGGDSNINGDDISDFLITKDNKEVLIMSDSPEISNIFKGSGRQYGANLHGYKKPVQPVVLEEEPRFEKPISIPRDTRDLGYTLPKPGQPRFPELYKYSPDTPTKFSFTSPTGEYNQQKTMYFPSKSALKSFTEGVRGATYQEGADYATATGNLQDGGDIPVDPMGYWNPENVGDPVIIPSNIITMKGVDQPLMGISDTGDVQYMEPGKNYEFDGEYVTEYPVAKGGVSVNDADAQPIEKLNQLLNFTNYNKPTKGGWLDKYQ